LRETLAARGAWANVKPMPRRVNIPAVRAFPYRYRNLVERFFNKIKDFRGIAMLQKTLRQLPRPGQTCRRRYLDAIYESVT
jgi:transposase